MEGGGRRIQLKKNDITCAERESERERGREIGEVARMKGASERRLGETALDGLTAEQMWTSEGGRERERQGGRKRMTDIERKRGSIFIDLLVT